MDRKIVIKNLLSVLVFSIFVFLALGSDENEKTGNEQSITKKEVRNWKEKEHSTMAYIMLKKSSKKKLGGTK